MKANKVEGLTGVDFMNFHKATPIPASVQVQTDRWTEQKTSKSTLACVLKKTLAKRFSARVQSQCGEDNVCQKVEGEHLAHHVQGKGRSQPWHESPTVCFLKETGVWGTGLGDSQKWYPKHRQQKKKKQKYWASLEL